MSWFLAYFVATIQLVASVQYSVEVLELSPVPVLSYLDGNSAFQQIFNPSFIVASSATRGVSGIVARSQNCSADIGGKCVFCSGQGPQASVLTFSPFVDNAPTPVTAASVIFSPEPGNPLEKYGTEDPRIAFDEKTGTYHMFYTCYGESKGSADGSVLLCQAISTNPTDPSSWRRLGPVFPSIQDSKSASLLIRDSPPHYLFWGAGQIRVAMSDDPNTWPNEGDLFITPRADMFDSLGVESGPPPLKLSTGDYLFIYNSWSKGWPNDPASGYNPSFVILNGSNPASIVQRGSAPFLSPTLPWQRGETPYTCNAPRVVFVEAAIATGNTDEFRIFFGGADATVGEAIIKVNLS